MLEPDTWEKFLFVCSAQKLHSTSVIPKLGWWETDIHRYNPIKRFDELGDEREKLAVEETVVVVDHKVVYAELKNISFWSELLLEVSLYLQFK